MSAPSGGASSAPQCACTNISIMQLFHELKQKYPGVPDHVVSSTISSHCHDRSACQSRLECEAKHYISHLYPSSSLSASKKEGKDILLPQQCPNQLLITRQSDKPQIILISSACPQKGVSSFTENLDENDNQNIIRDKQKECEDECISVPCELPLLVDCIGDSHVGNTESVSIDSDQEFHTVEPVPSVDGKCLVKDENSNNCSACIADNKCYQILKSNKVTSDLNKKLIDQNKKNVLGSASPSTDGKTDVPIEVNTKLKRPTTLEFSSDPHFSGFDTKPPSGSQVQLPELAEESHKPDEAPGESEPSKQYKYCDKSSETCNVKDDYESHQDLYPLNVSVNLNCRMDVLPPGNRQQQSQFSEPWRGNYSSPGNFTSVNLTVCTPTSSGHGPIDNRNVQYAGDPRQRGFEGRVQITVSPASSQPPYRIQHPSQGRHYYSPLPQMMPETPPTSPIDALVRRQKARLARLQRALAVERGRLASMQREVSVLSAPPPAPPARLRPAVLRLRHLCQRLTRQLDRATSTHDGEFYDHIYTGQRVSRGDPTPEESGGSWQCHVCTFSNHGLLNKCEECDMPRILLGRPPVSRSASHTVSQGLLSVLPLVHSPTPDPTPEECNIESLILSMDRQLVNPDAKVHATG